MKIGGPLKTIFAKPLEVPVGAPAGKPAPKAPMGPETQAGGCPGEQTMKIPDYVLPIVGWRAWKLDPAGLRSLNGEPWLPGTPLAAACKLFGDRPSVTAHEAPVRECRCGVYAAKSFVDLVRAGYDRYGVHGEVCLWGTVVEHEIGWRSAYAYPKRLVLLPGSLPRDMGRRERLLNMLTAYGSEIALATEQGTVPFWDERSGFNATAVSLLIKPCQSWYDCHRQKQQIKPGDRLAVLSHGIGVVMRVEGECVYARLGRGDALRAERKDIVWHPGNMRWEASGGEIRLANERAE